MARTTTNTTTTTALAKEQLAAAQAEITELQARRDTLNEQYTQARLRGDGEAMSKLHYEAVGIDERLTGSEIKVLNLKIAAVGEEIAACQTAINGLAPDLSTAQAEYQRAASALRDVEAKQSQLREKEAGLQYDLSSLQGQRTTLIHYGLAR